MDINRVLVLIKGEDSTVRIERFEMQDAVVWITYRGSPKAYPCKLRDFLIFENPVITDISEETVVYHNDIPLYQVSQIIHFGSKVRIKNNRGISRVYDARAIRMEGNAVTPTAKTTLQYWTDIARYTSVKEEQQDRETFLKDQFDRLRFVSPNSVLVSYLNGNEIRVKPATASEPIFPFKFNLSQKEALDNALRSHISIIEGPPGTGKTQTILNILANLVMQGKTVAVVSSNNAAVQNVHDKLQAMGYHFLVAALGNRENKKRFFDDPPQQDVSAWKSDTDEGVLLERIKELNAYIHHLMEVEREMVQLKQQLSAYLLEQEHFEIFYTRQNVEEVGKLSFYRLTPEKILSFLLEHRLAVERGKAKTSLHKLKLLVRHGFTALKRMQNQGSDVLLSFQRKYYELKVEQLNRKIAEMQSELVLHSFEPLLNEHQQLSEKLFRHKLYQKYLGQTPVQSSATAYKKIFREFVDQYPIMLSTTHSLRTCIPENFLFDYVILDESSQVDLLTGGLALSCCKNVIVVGDTKQLPQIVDETIQQKMGPHRVIIGGTYDYFQHNLLSSMLHLYGDTVPKVMLKEHYRCHPQIIGFCNQKYYNGQLISFTSEGDNDSPLLIYRTTQGHHMSDVKHGRKGKFNQRELDVIEQEVLVNLATASRSHTDIGFTTPYRKQVEKAAHQLHRDIEMDTIHKYQGREKQTMILSTVLDSSNGGKMGLQFVNDPSLINVAVSRAQQRFILVTDHSLFRDYNSEIGDLIRYMEYNTLDDNIVESQIVSVFDLLYKDYSQRLRNFKRRVKQRSVYASENIIWTLLEEILQDSRYNGLTCSDQVLIRNLFHDLSRLGGEQRRYVNNGSSVDFVLHHKLDKSPVLAIEVDGFAFHENNPRQLERDGWKDGIFRTYGLPLLRLPTTGSGEEQKIRMKLDEIIKG